MFANVSYADETKPCLYQKSDQFELLQVSDCLRFTAWSRQPDDSDASISKKVLSTALYNSDGLGQLYSQYGLFYFDKSGKARRTLSYDNGPDYFQEDLARISWSEKVGFMDKQLNIAIPPIYDFAFPFKDGYSVVCNGCKKEKQGEHHIMVDGRWGVIDKSGKTVIPVILSESDAYKARNKF